MIAFGLDLGGTKIEAAALSPDGAFRARVRPPTPGAYAAGLEAVADALEEAERQAGVRADRLGIGGPGAVNPRTGVVRNANSTWLNARPFPEDPARRLGRPVRYANDADCLAVSEGRDGVAAGAEAVFSVILGTAVGGGITFGGRLAGGANGIAGEWGHGPCPLPVQTSSRDRTAGADGADAWRPGSRGPPWRGTTVGALRRRRWPAWPQSTQDGWCGDWPGW